MKNSHIEFGLWSDDEKLTEAALEFFCDLVRLSEPYEAAPPGPVRNWSQPTGDNEAFAEYVAEHADQCDA